MRNLLAAAALAAIVATGWHPATAQEIPAGPPAFDPAPYLGQGDAYNCPSFSSQADAQAVLRADPTDPNGLDADRDGIACESNRAPKDLVAVPRL